MIVDFPVMGIEIARNQMAGLIDHVRNLILDWSLDLEKAGILGGELGFSPEEQRQASKVSINIGTFNGNLHQGDVSGSAARVNQGATDQSHNTVGSAFSFDELAEAVERGVQSRTDREVLLEAVERLRDTQGTGGFVQAYHTFISRAADYVGLTGPFLPALSSLLLGSQAVA